MPQLKRSTHEDCPKCGYNLSHYNLKSCTRCGFVFIRPAMPWENQPPLNTSTKRDINFLLGDVAVNTCTKRDVDVTLGDIPVNTTTKRVKSCNDMGASNAQKKQTPLKKSSST